MAETLRELVVALSLDSNNFSRNMRTINQQQRAVEQYSRVVVTVGLEPTVRKLYSRDCPLGSSLLTV